ncbi:hypothetical protein GE21DRAFT_1061281 [Neurospora crassa]|nr:hypothetical protein GE21DRAFT_1061281 [Neurospora crassa]
MRSDRSMVSRHRTPLHLPPSLSSCFFKISIGIVWRCTRTHWCRVPFRCRFPCRCWRLLTLRCMYERMAWEDGMSCWCRWGWSWDYSTVMCCLVFILDWMQELWEFLMSASLSFGA